MRTHTQRGFTMTEMMVVLVIVAILVGVGAPSYRYVTTSNRMSSEINGLLGDLQFARGEAIKEGQRVSVCSTTDGATCASSTTWTKGWLVFVDGGTVGTIDGTDTILRVQRALTGDKLTADNSTKWIAFNREGFATGLTAAVTTLTLQDSTSNVGYNRCLAVTIVGAMATQTHTSSTC